MHCCTHLQNPRWYLMQRRMQKCRNFNQKPENERGLMQISSWIMDSLYKVGERFRIILDGIFMQCQWKCAQKWSIKWKSTRESEIVECMCEHTFSDLTMVYQPILHENVHTFDWLIKISWCILKYGAHVCTNLQNHRWYLKKRCMKMWTNLTHLLQFCNNPRWYLS